MKKFLTILLVLILIFTSSCSAQKIETPASFYYLNKNAAFIGEDAIIAEEITDATQYPSLSSFLSAYLNGPQDSTLVSPFPKGTVLVGYTKSNDTLVITLSNNFAALTGIDLSLACCTLAKTVMEFSGTEAVTIQTLTELLDGEKSIAISQDSIILTDMPQETISDNQS